MNPSEALEWLLENGAGEQSDVATDLNVKAAASEGRLRRQQEAVPGKTSLSHNHLFCDLPCTLNSWKFFG